ncbi:MAG: amidohydrolase family protein [Acidimicrobiales bacterium]
MSRRIGAPLVDADNHYYETEDAFTRHLAADMARQKPFRWITDDGGQRRLLVAGQLYRRIVNPTFDPVARPGYLLALYEQEGVLDYSRTGESNEPIRPEYRDRVRRLEIMDRDDVEQIWLFPTLAMNVEQILRHDVAMTAAALRSFNRWLEEEWGFDYQGRIHAVPLFSLCDPQVAVDELRWAMDRGTRLIHVRACPVPGGPRGRSLADPEFDEFWALANEGGLTITVHSGDTGMFERAAEWGDLKDPPTHLTTRFQLVFRDGREVFEAVADMILHGLFARFPRLRVVSVEMGSSWCAPLLDSLSKVRKRREFGLSGGDPVETFRQHVYVSPYPEESLEEVARIMTPDRVVFGSDWPHPEGVARPSDFFAATGSLSDRELTRIARDNALDLMRAPTW